MHRLLKDNDESNDMESFYPSAFGVFHGLTIGLVAVATRESFSSVDANVLQEASVISACYIDISRIQRRMSRNPRADEGVCALHRQGCLASLTGLHVFLIAAMDYPFRGEFSVSEEAFEIIYERLMPIPAAK